MKEIQYKTFSLKIHQKNWQLNNPNQCQFELTFRCHFHCRHCYSDCFNQPACFKKELNTKRVKFILDKIQKSGVIWLCFTGGDPLCRSDFLEIYAYAKEKGFLITIFTNGYALTKDIISALKAKPPFVVEMTLNAVSENLFEKISQVKGSFAKVMNAIKLMQKAKIPLKIKTQVTKDNVDELPKIKEFLKKIKLEFIPSSILYPRLNGDISPCQLRITPQEVLNLERKNFLGQEDCNFLKNKEAVLEETVSKTENNQTNIFPCAIGGGDGIYLDPYGHIFLCYLIRQPRFNVVGMEIEEALSHLLAWARKREFSAKAKCKSCFLRRQCCWCPGRAYLEKGQMEEAIEYYCQLAKLS